MTFKAFASLRHASSLSLISGWASYLAMGRRGTPERVASIPEKLNEDEAKGWTLKHLHALEDQLSLHRLGH